MTSTSSVDAQLDRARRVAGRDVEHRVAEDPVEVDRFGRERAPLVEAGQEQQVVDEERHPGALAADAPHGVVEHLGFLEAAAPVQVGEPADRGDRRSELVRRIGDEPTQPALDALVLVHHEVEDLGQLAGLGAGVVDLDATGAVAGHDRPGGRGDVADRAQAEQHHPPAGQEEGARGRRPPRRSSPRSGGCSCRPCRPGTRRRGGEPRWPGRRARRLATARTRVTPSRRRRSRRTSSPARRRSTRGPRSPRRPRGCGARHRSRGRR